ncbi:hypothetical protein IW262DRAFT_1291716 [Armillaria fumosa]|nr:hypothetical protein IW262DRAFT_1291716 [Armillaria fumosa]
MVKYTSRSPTADDDQTNGRLQGPEVGIYFDAGFSDCGFAPESDGYCVPFIAKKKLPIFHRDCSFHTNVEPPQVRFVGDINAYFGDETGHQDCQCANTAYCLNTGYAGYSVLAYIRKMRKIVQFQKLFSFD